MMKRIVVALVVSLPLAAAAQTFPTKTVRIVSPYPAGAGPDTVARLFQPYFTTRKHGTGLGLFVTQQLVSDHGGTVAFESAPGQGTTFRVVLPLSEG